MAEKKLYIGVDLSRSYAQVSYFTEDKREPETISTIAGSEIYQIPLALYKKKGVGLWYFGREAINAAEQEQSSCVEDFWTLALAGETITIEGQPFSAIDLLTVFLRKVLMLPRRLSGEMCIAALGLTIERLDEKNTALFFDIMKKIGIEKSQFFMMDHKESFYYYALNQKEELWNHDVALFSYEDDRLTEYYLTRDSATVPQRIQLLEQEYGSLRGDHDLEFSTIIREAFAGKIISATFLVGDDFDGDWMKQSIRTLCSGRKAFLGKNLYSKGVCYAAGVREKLFAWPFVYLGDNEMKYNICLKLKNRGEIMLYSLISAGESWYEAKAECEVFLDDSASVDFWLQYPDSKEAKVASLELTDLPKRPNKTTRLRICVVPLSDEKARVKVKDLGFGELFRSSEKEWEYVISM